MSLQPAATVNVTFAVVPVTMIELDDVTAAFAEGHVGGGVEHVPLVSLVMRAWAGASPFPQCATSCTFTHTTVAESDRVRAGELEAVVAAEVVLCNLGPGRAVGRDRHPDVRVRA